MAKVRVRVWDRPEKGVKAIAMTGSGLIGRRKYVIDGTSGTWTRLPSNAERVREMLLLEFKRCGFVPKTFKVIEVRREGAEPNERGAFYLNFGYLRGLDPDEVWRLLHEVRGQRSEIRSGKKLTAPVRRFPDNCGGRVVIEALARLEQRVERAPGLMAPEAPRPKSQASMEAL
jgi:hypothetical protein